MTPIGTLKAKLIDKNLLSENVELLEAIDLIFNTTSSANHYKLNSYEIELLKMSESDIENGRVISEEELEKRDQDWMKYV